MGLRDKTYWHVWSADPALDRDNDHCDPEKAYQTGDESWLPVKAGLTPIRWRVRRTTGRERKYVEDRFRDANASTNGYGWGQLSYDVVSLVLDGAEPDRIDGKPYTIDRVLNRSGYQVATDASMDTVLERRGLVEELCNRVLREDIFGDPLLWRG